MKKSYIEPALQVVEMNYGSNILSSGSLTQSTSGAEEVDDGTELGARGFRSIFDDDED